MKNIEKQFVKYLESKEFAQRTQKECLLNLKQFFDWIHTCAEHGRSKEDLQITKPDILKYLEHLKNKGLQNVTRKNYLTAINHYFTFLYENEQITSNPCQFLKIRGANKKTLHKTYTPEELDQLFDNYYQLYICSYDDSRQRHEHSRLCSALGRERNAAVLSILINQGATTKEIERIEIGDLAIYRTYARNFWSTKQQTTTNYSCHYQ